MGFMDKAKKLAEQAQTKLDEVQKDLNQKQGSAGGASAGGGPAVEYDEHGRAKTPQSPAPDLPANPSGDLGAPKGDPLSAEPTAPPAATPQQGDPLSDDGAPSPSPAAGVEPADEVRATPTQGDPLLEESERKSPPATGGGITSGDPLG